MASSKKRYFAALDGLRLLAIAAVFVYHADPTALPGGFAGVTLFFVITGYLLASSIDRQLHGKGSFSYLDHLKRRVTRLLPAMLALVGIVALLSIIVARPLVPKMKDDVVPALLFFENWFYIIRNVSYFAASGLPSPLTHFWYLAVVMQFYIVWPLVLMALAKLGVRRRTRVILCAVLAIASQVLMAVLYDPAADTNRVYYGLDTRAGELLIGALIAEIAPIVSSRKQEPRSARTSRSNRSRTSEPLVSDAALSIAAAVGLACFAAFSLRVNGYSSLPYYGGFLVLALCSGTLVLACIRETTVFARIFSLPPLSALGKRSFSLYLWHYPLLLIMNPATRTTDLTLAQRVIQVAVIFAAAELSYRLFEAPRTVTVPGTRRAEPTSVTVVGFPAAQRVLSAAGAIFALVVLLLPATPLQATEPEPTLASRVRAAADANSGDGAGEQIAPPRERVFYTVEGTVFQGTPFEEAINRINAFSHYEIDEATGACNAPAILIGDSVPLGAEQQFSEMFPYGHINAQVSRQLNEGADILRGVWDQGIDGDIIIWSLGDNGIAYEEDVRELIEMCGSRRVYLVTCRVPLALQDMNNALFHEVAEQYDNCEVIDWHAWSAGHDEYFWDDGTHLTPEGADAYCRMIRTAIAGS